MWTIFWQGVGNPVLMAYTILSVCVVYTILSWRLYRHFNRYERRREYLHNRLVNCYYLIPETGNRKGK